MKDDDLSSLLDKYIQPRGFAGKQPVTLEERLDRLNEIGIALSSENNIQLLLEKILTSAKDMTNADAGTIYHFINDRLEFAILMNDSLGLHQGGSAETACSLPAIHLHQQDGTENNHNVAAFSAVKKQTVNIEDCYQDEKFDFSGTRLFDEKMHYTSTSFLTVPIIDHEDNLFGVLQLINAKNLRTQAIEAFSAESQKLVESLASQAAIALSNKKLLEDQKKLFEAFIELIAGAIDDKSPYTGGHCRRVPVLTMMLAEATIKTDNGPMKDFSMTEDDIYTLKIAGWLHDCGKIITPPHVVDKSTKLETIHDRIHEVETRFEVLKRDARIEYLETLASDTALSETQKQQLNEQYHKRIQTLDDDCQFIRTANIGGEFITEEHRERINRIARYQWKNPQGEMQNLLSDEEVYNLHIARGTLTPEEREIINGHMTSTIKMLEALPYPEHLSQVPEYAGGHHEKMDGSGYPKGLTREQLSVPARIMGIADIFEAITARDRPYRKGTKLSDALKLMGKFRLDNHIDPDLFDVFIREKVYLQYAREFLSEEQIDEVDENEIPGYTP